MTALFHISSQCKKAEYADKIKSILASGQKTTAEVAAMLGLADVTAYRRLYAMSSIGLLIRSKTKGIRLITWSLPGPDGKLAAPAIKPRPYVRTFVAGGRSEREFYGHRDMAMAARR